jgi:hypothetical protein
VAHEATMDSIAMFTEEVMPQFADVTEEAA